MGIKYKVVVTFQGVGTLEIEAASPESARAAAKELTIADLARAGRTDLLAFQVSAREIVPASGGEASGEEDAPHKPRPSGWYRPA